MQESPTAAEVEELLPPEPVDPQRGALWVLPKVPVNLSVSR